MQKRNVLNSPRLLEFKRNKRRIFLKKILFFLLCFVLVFFILAYLSRLDSLNIKEVEIRGNRVVNSEELTGLAEKQISGKYLWLFPKTNVLIYPQKELASELQNNFKRIKSLSLAIGENNILIISLVEREAKYLWCGITPVTTLDQDIDNQKCYFLDEEGYFFDTAPYFSDEVYFKFYGTPETTSQTIDDPLGSYFSKNNFEQLVLFKNAILSMGLKPVYLYVTSKEQAEIYLAKENSSAVAPKIIFRMDADFQNIAENLKAALETEPLQTKIKNKYSLLQYIDLRFENKVYNKFNE